MIYIVAAFFCLKNGQRLGEGAKEEWESEC